MTKGAIKNWRVMTPTSDVGIITEYEYGYGHEYECYVSLCALHAARSLFVLIKSRIASLTTLGVPR